MSKLKEAITCILCVAVMPFAIALGLLSGAMLYVLLILSPILHLFPKTRPLAKLTWRKLQGIE